MTRIDAILEAAAARKLMPTSLSSREVRDQIAAEIRQRSVFLARGTNVKFLSALADILDAYIAGRMNDADTRLAIVTELESLGYTPEGGFPGDPSVPPAEAGTLRDLSSTSRMQLVLDTNAQFMFGAGQKAGGESPENAFDYPAWELIRVAPREVPRGFKMTSAGLVPLPGDSWEERWVACGGVLIDNRMIALKGDDIWKKLGDSQLFDDALDTDHPPFAYNSGKGWRAVPRRECIALGIISADWKPEGFRAWRLNEDLKIGAAKIPRDLLEAAKKGLDAQLVGKELRKRQARDAAREAYLSQP